MWRHIPKVGQKHGQKRREKRKQRQRWVLERQSPVRKQRRRQKQRHRQKESLLQRRWQSLHSRNSCTACLGLQDVIRHTMWWSSQEQLNGWSTHYAKAYSAAWHRAKRPGQDKKACAAAGREAQQKFLSKT